MNLLQLFSKDRRKQRALSRATAKAANHLIKSDDRRPALSYLAEEGSEAAHAGLLRRFTFNYTTNTVNDEEEKHFVFDTLKAIGPRLLPSLVSHLRTSPSLSWGLRLLKETTDAETCWHTLVQLLGDYTPDYVRDPSRKLQLVTFIGELDDPRVGAVLLPFLADHDETVRFVVAEALLKHHDEGAREPLLALLINPQEESLRIKNRIARGFSETDWLVKGHRSTVESILPSEYYVDGKGHIRPKQRREDS